MFRRTIRNRPYTFRPIVVTPPDDTGGGAAEPGWVARVRDLAAVETGIDSDQMNFIWREFEYFDSDEWVAGLGSGSWSAGAGGSSNEHGGVVYGANKSILGTSTILTNPAADKFFVYARFQTPTNSGDATAFHIVGFSKTNESQLFGIGSVGSNNNGGVSNYGVHVYPSGGGLIDTGVAYASGFHEHYFRSDGTTAKAWIDSNAPATAAASGLPSAGSGWVIYMLMNSGLFVASPVDRLAYAFEGAS